MPTQKSIQEVAELTDTFSGASLVIATDYRGMSVGGMDQLRRSLRNNGAQYRIAKNTLVRIAADQAGRPELKELVTGPRGYVTTTGDPAVTAKTLMDHIRNNRLTMKVQGGLLNGALLSEQRVEYLASLPGHDQLVARLMGQLNAPVAGLVTVLSGPIRALAIVLQRHIEKTGAPGTQPAPEPAAREAATDSGQEGQPEEAQPATA